MAYPTSSSEFMPTSSIELPPSTALNKTRPSTRRTSSRPNSAQSQNDENAYPSSGSISLATAASKAALGKKPAAAVGLSARGLAAVSAPRAGLRTSSRTTNSIWASRPVEVMPEPRREGEGSQPLAAKRRVVSGTSVPSVGGSKRAVRPMGKPASKVSQMKGMGIVRTGPAVVAPRSSPSTREASTSSARLNNIGLALEGANSLAAARAPKRSFDPSSEDDGARVESPLKRRVLPPALAQSPTKPSGPFDLTSPRKASAILSPAKGTGARVVRLGELPQRLNFSPLRENKSNAFGSSGLRSPVKMLKAEENAMLVDEEEFTPISPELAVLHDSSSDEDEIDWLSPKKPSALAPPRGAGLEPVDNFSLDSPTKLSRPGSKELNMPQRNALRSPPPHRAKAPTSAKMQRAPAQVLALSAASSLLPPPSQIRPASPDEMSIDPALLIRTVTPELSTSGLVSKRGLAPAPTPQRFLSSPAPAHRAHPSPAPGSAFRSGIPRLVPPTPAVIPPTPAGLVASTKQSATPAEATPSAAASTVVTNKGAAGSVTSETAARLQNLQAMLSRLAMPRQGGAAGAGAAGERRSSLSGYAPPAKGPTTARTSLTRRPSTAPAQTTGDSIAPLAPEGPSAPSRRTSLTTVVAPSGRSTAAITAPVEGDKSSVLRGVVAFVDVRTGEGDDAGMLFVSMLKDMGARVATRPVPSLTHIIFKAGKPSTLQRAKTPPPGSAVPHLVGIGWVVQSAEKGEKAPEEQFVVTEDQQAEQLGLGVPGLGLQAKRRRSMEPKALASLSDRAPGSGENAGLKATIAASIERARLRSLQFAPKVGSPLSKRVMSMSLEDLEKKVEEEEAEAEGNDVVMA